MDSARSNIAIEVVETAPVAAARACARIAVRCRIAARRSSTRRAASRPRALAANCGATFPRRRITRASTPTRRKTRAGGVSRRQDRSDRGDDRVRHGHRQGRYPHRDPHRLAGKPGSVLPGDRARGARWRAEPRDPDALLRRPLHARFLLRARLSGRHSPGRRFSSGCARSRSRESRVEKRVHGCRDVSRRRSKSSGCTAAR